MYKTINKLKKVGEKLYSEFGTESYEIRCQLYDIRKELESEFKKLNIHNVIVPKGTFCAYKGNNPSLKCNSARFKCLDCKHGIAQNAL
jgi:5-formaminoimidazole-4-carboxamide-1-beta-D-ribofuranosyl 5'-monophosphate synthetase